MYSSDVDIVFTYNNAPESATFNYVLNSDAPVDITGSPIKLTGLAEQTHTVTVNMLNELEEIVVSDIVTFTVDVSSIIQVANIAELRAGLVDGTTIYELTGEAFITYQRATRNQKYIQDATGGILIDDNAGIITTVYNQYDGITGIKGKLSLFNQLLQFVPVENTAAASSTDNEIIPEVVQITDVNTTITDYESELVEFKNVSFVETGVFVLNTNYTLTDGTNDIIFSASFVEADYIGEPIPEGLHNVTAFVGRYNATAQVVSRDFADIVPVLQASIMITYPTDGSTITLSNDVTATWVVNNFDLGTDGEVTYTLKNTITSTLEATGTTQDLSIEFLGLDNATYSLEVELVDMSGDPFDPIISSSVNFTINVSKIDETSEFISVYPNPTTDIINIKGCLLYTSPSPRDRTRSRMPSSA